MNGYKLFGAINTKFYFYEMGRYLTNVILQIITLIDMATDWNLFQNRSKPWAKYGGPVPKPGNWRELEQRPTTWSRPNFKKMKAYAAEKKK